MNANCEVEGDENGGESGGNSDGDMTKIYFPDDITPQIYNWPHGDNVDAEFSDTWRHITSYQFINSVTHEYIDLLYTADESKRKKHRFVALLKGFLLPAPHMKDRSKSIYVEIPIKCYAIDFGLSPEDPDRGFWLEGVEFNTWYKLELPHKDYATIANKSLKFASEYVKFYDSLVYGIGSGTPLAKRKQKLCCDYTLQEVYQKSNHHFEIEFVEKHVEQFYDLIEPHFSKSCRLMTNLLDLIDFSSHQTTTTNQNPKRKIDDIYSGNNKNKNSAHGHGDNKQKQKTTTTTSSSSSSESSSENDKSKSAGAGSVREGKKEEEVRLEESHSNIAESSLPKRRHVIEISDDEDDDMIARIKQKSIDQELKQNHPMKREQEKEKEKEKDAMESEEEEDEIEFSDDMIFSTKTKQSYLSSSTSTSASSSSSKNLSIPKSTSKESSRHNLADQKSELKKKTVSIKATTRPPAPPSTPSSEPPLLPPPPPVAPAKEIENENKKLHISKKCSQPSSSNSNKLKTTEPSTPWSSSSLPLPKTDGEKKAERLQKVKTIIETIAPLKSTNDSLKKNESFTVSPSQSSETPRERSSNLNNLLAQATQKPEEKKNSMKPDWQRRAEKQQAERLALLQKKKELPKDLQPIGLKLQPPEKKKILDPPPPPSSASNRSTTSLAKTLTPQTQSSLNSKNQLLKAAKSQTITHLNTGLVLSTTSSPRAASATSPRGSSTSTSTTTPTMIAPSPRTPMSSSSTTLLSVSVAPHSLASHPSHSTTTPNTTATSTSTTSTTSPRAAFDPRRRRVRWKDSQPSGTLFTIYYENRDLLHFQNPSNQEGGDEEEEQTEGGSGVSAGSVVGSGSIGKTRTIEEQNETKKYNFSGKERNVRDLLGKKISVEEDEDEEEVVVERGVQ